MISINHTCENRKSKNIYEIFALYREIYYRNYEYQINITSK